MKRIIAILMALALIVALTACGGSGYGVKDATSDEEAEDIKADKYIPDGFDGLLDYYLDKGYIYNYVYSGDGSDKKEMTSDVYYEMLGANDGIRYYFTDNKSFIEFYDFSGEQNDTAKKILEDIEDDGKFTAMEDGDELTAVISKSGKYVAVYNPANNYDYGKITDELDKW